MQAPEAQGPQVAPEAMPQIAANGNMPETAAGGGQMREQVAATTDQLSEHIGRAVALEKMKADQTTMTAATAQAYAVMSKALYGDDDTQGYKTTMGQDAIKKFSDVIPNVKAQLDEIKNGLPNEDTQRMFGSEYDKILDQTTSQAHEHLNQQIQVNAVNQMTDGVKIVSDVAARSHADPQSIQDAKDIVSKMIVSYGLGHNRDYVPGPNGEETSEPGEATKKLLADKMSALNVNVLRAKQADGDFIGAQQYFKANENEIEPEAREIARKAVQEGADRTMGTNEASAIIAKYPMRNSTDKNGTGGWEDAIAKIPDANIRKAAEAQVEHAYSESERNQKAYHDQTVSSAFSAIKPGQGSAEMQLPPSLYTDPVMNDADKAACERLANPPKVSDHQAFIEFGQMKSSDIGKLSQQDFTSNYLSKFSPSDKDQAIQMWKDSVKGIESPQLSSTLLINKTAMSTFKLFGGASASATTTKDWEPEERENYQQFQRDVTDAVHQKEINDFGGKRKCTTEEVEKISDQIMTQKTKDKGGWFNSNQQVTKYQNIDNLPEDDVKQIREVRKAKGLSTTDADILRMYNQAHATKVSASSDDADAE